MKIPIKPFCTFNILAPLVYIDPTRNPQNIATVIGITSWVAACGDVNYPDVHGRVTYALQWIEKETGRYITKYSVITLYWSYFAKDVIQK
jgi:hypothetical protein